MPTGDAWTLRTLHFRQLWAEADGIDFPSEFAAADARTASTGDESPGRPLAELSEPRRAAIAALTRPLVTIAVAGLDARQPFEDPGHHRRVVSATRDMQTVIVARQELTGSVSLGGTVSITRHTASDWTRDIVAMLPRSDGAGSLPTDTDVTFRQLPGIDASTIAVVEPPPRPSAAAAFARDDPATCGSLRIQVGSAVDGHRPSVIEARYRDIPGDGRYLLIVDEPGVAMGVDAARFASTLNRVVNTVRRRHGEQP
ncbi:hypothetical protein [uncultured Williamsia sp.]|uniref:hypothetical protein n=1 Tax=uncultured Williamsia sp. TaxID=259311 RepID=UPI002621465C|nr:hypothetical protein [uncultured Williamsia sp.]